MKISIISVISRLQYEKLDFEMKPTIFQLDLIFSIVFSQHIKVTSSVIFEMMFYSLISQKSSESFAL